MLLTILLTLSDYQSDEIPVGKEDDTWLRVWHFL